MELGKSGRPRSAMPGTLPSVGHLFPLAPHPPRPLPRPTGDKRRASHGGSLLLEDTWRHQGPWAGPTRGLDPPPGPPELSGIE